MATHAYKIMNGIEIGEGISKLNGAMFYIGLILYIMRTILHVVLASEYCR